jgi:hypothetical protein
MVGFSQKQINSLFHIQTKAEGTPVFLYAVFIVTIARCKAVWTHILWPGIALVSKQKNVLMRASVCTELALSTITATDAWLYLIFM